MLNFCSMKNYIISLTGENSHNITIPLGQGSLSIGTKGISLGRYDIWVDQDSPINWNAFNEFFTQAEKQNIEHYPCGNWPRFFYYSGNDQGFIEWSHLRLIEDFHWFPLESTSANFSNANIRRLFLHVGANKIKISSANKIDTFGLSGNLEEVLIKECNFRSVIFTPTISKKETSCYLLPSYGLNGVVSIDINNSPVGQPFDCKSLLQYRNIEHLNLSGNLINLEALTELKNLQSLGLRFVPDLTNMPKLTSWTELRGFIAWNIEEVTGKRLRAELKELSKDRELRYSNVSKLRKPIWFTTTYEIPFSGWDTKNEKIATKEYKNCLKEIKKAKTEKEIYNLIVTFIEKINQLPNIETSEREDVGIAVDQLVASSKLNIPKELGSKWFNEIRDF